MLLYLTYIASILQTAHPHFLHGWTKAKAHDNVVSDNLKRSI